MKRTFLNKLHKKRLSQFFHAFDQYLFGVAANEKQARECAYGFGIAETIKGHSLTRLAHHYCKHWRVWKRQNLNPYTRRYLFNEKEWDAMTKVVRSLEKDFNDFTTSGFVYRHARFRLIPCTRASMIEALKLCGHILPEKPLVKSCKAPSSE